MNYLFYGIFLFYDKFIKRDNLFEHPFESTTSVIALIINLFLLSVFNIISEENGVRFAPLIIFISFAIFCLTWKLLNIYFKPRYKKILKQMECKSKTQKMIISILSVALVLFVIFKLFVMDGTYEFYKYLKELYNGLYLQ